MGRDHLILHQGWAVYSLLYRNQKQADLIKWSNVTQYTQHNDINADRDGETEEWKAQNQEEIESSW